MPPAQPLRVRFYSAWFCPYAQRAWMALGYAQVPFEKIEALVVTGDAYVKRPDLLEVSPKGLVPVLVVPGGMVSETQRVDDNLVVTESIDCIEFIDGMARVAGTPLVPDGSFLRDAHRFNREVCSVYYRVLMKQDADERQEAFSAFVAGLEEFVSEVAEGGFYRSVHPTIVDYTVFPWIHRIFVIEHYRPELVLSSSMDPGRSAALREYASRMEGLPCVAATLANPGELLEVYRRYARGTAESKVGDAVRAGKHAHEI